MGRSGQSRNSGCGRTRSRSRFQSAVGPRKSKPCDKSVARSHHPPDLRSCNLTRFPSAHRTVSSCQHHRAAAKTKFSNRPDFTSWVCTSLCTVTPFSFRHSCTQCGFVKVSPGRHLGAEIGIIRLCSLSSAPSDAGCDWIRFLWLQEAGALSRSCVFKLDHQNTIDSSLFR